LRVADDLSARTVLETGMPDHVRYILLPDFLFGFADVGDLRDGVDRHRQIFRRDMCAATKGVQHRGATLFHAGRG